MARLVAKGATVKAYDPAVTSLNLDGVDVVDNAYAACEGASAIVVATEWNEFALLDFDRISDLVAARNMIDARNLLDRGALTKRGFTYQGVGRSLMARVVITGGAGFLGSHLADELLGRGDEVVAIDNLSTGNNANIEHLLALPGFTFVEHDVSKYVWVPGERRCRAPLRRPASPVDYLKLPIQTLKVGSLGTHNTLGLAKAKGATYFLASTSEVYGDPQVHPQTEGYWGNVNPVGPRGVYDEAKRFSEAMTMAYHRSHGIDTHRPDLQHLWAAHAA